MTIKIELSKQPDATELQVLEDGLNQFTASHIGDDDRKDITFLLRNEQSEIVGGIKGSHGSYGWLWVDTLWVNDALRKQGFGGQLLLALEQQAIKNGCQNAYLNTFSFSGVEFYKKHGYSVYAELKDFPKGHSVFSLQKKLVEN